MVYTGTMARIVSRSLSALVFLVGCVQAQQTDDLHDHSQLHAEKGLEAAQHFPGYASLCDLEMVFRDVNVLKTDPPRERSASGRSRSSSSGESADTSFPPTQVFDNLYFVGDRGVSSWLLGTDEGYILIDALTTNEAAKSTIEAGIVELGLDASAIEYLLITHAHGDHFGGHEYIEATYDPRIVMSEKDWQLASQLREHPRFGAPPAKDMSVVDSDQLTAGDTTLDIYVTTAHTPGTISPVFTVYDNGVTHRAMLWGGTGFNFGSNHERMNAYAASAGRMRDVAIKENVTVFLSNHGRRDGSIERMEALETRAAGEQHPFVMGEELLKVFDVLEQCALAQADRIKDSESDAR